MAKKELLDRYTGELVTGSIRSNRLVPVSIKKEPVDPFTRTERGYVPPTIQIADMMNAGLRLAAERRARFDSVELEVPEEEDIPLDPMREQGLDLADVSRLAEKAKNAATALQEAVRTKKKEVADAAEKARIQEQVEKELQARQAVK